MEEIYELKKEYRNHAIAHGNATLTGDFKSANRNHDALISVLNILKGLGISGQNALLDLSNDEVDYVACWAATHALSFETVKSVQVLERLSKKHGPIGFNAKMVLRQWRSQDHTTP